ERSKAGEFKSFASSIFFALRGLLGVGTIFFCICVSIFGKGASGAKRASSSCCQNDNGRLDADGGEVCFANRVVQIADFGDERFTQLIQLRLDAGGHVVVNRAGTRRGRGIGAGDVGG